MKEADLILPEASGRYYCIASSRRDQRRYGRCECAEFSAMSIRKSLKEVMVCRVSKSHGIDVSTSICRPPSDYVPRETPSKLEKNAQKRKNIPGSCDYQEMFPECIYLFHFRRTEESDQNLQNRQTPHWQAQWKPSSTFRFDGLCLRVMWRHRFIHSQHHQVNQRIRRKKAEDASSHDMEA